MDADYDADDDYSNQSSVGCCSRLFSRHRRQQRTTDPVTYERRVSDVSISPGSFGSPPSPTAYPIMPQSSFSMPSAEISTAPIHPIPAVGSTVPTTGPRTFCVEEPPPMRHETRQVLSQQQSTSPSAIGFEEAQQPWLYPLSGDIGDETVHSGTVICIQDEAASSSERNVHQPIERDIPVNDIDNGQQSSIPNAGTDIDQQLTEAEAEASAEASAPPMPTSDGESSHADDELEVQQETQSILAKHATIYTEIGRILDRVEAGHHIIMLDPDNDNQIYILGINVERGMADFEALKSQPDSKQFSIVPHDVEIVQNGMPQHTKHLMPFTVEKNIAVNINGRREDPMHPSKCQLIVTATHINHNSKVDISDFEQSYYGVTVAHAFLDDFQTNRLLCSEQYDEMIREEMLTKNWNAQWSLRPHTTDSSRLLQMVRAPVLDYRQYLTSHEGFLQDIAVFGIPERQLREHRWREVDETIGEERLLIFNSGIQKYKIGGLFPITSQDDIISLCGKKVLVDSLEGTVTRPPQQAPRPCSPDSVHLGLHVTFRIKFPHRLESGHSGCMVYVVDKNNTHVYIIGMLTGYLKEFEQISGKRVYQAVVVGAGLERIEQKFPTTIKNIQTLRNTLSNQRAFQVVNRLQDGTLCD